MFRLRIVSTPVVLISALLALQVPALAQPSHVNYQGQLLKNGVLYSGTAEFKFALVSQSQTLWSNDGTSSGGGEPVASVTLEVSQSIFSVRLGETPMVSLTADLLHGHDDVMLRMWVDTGDGFQQLTDQPFSSTAFALQADASQRALGDFEVQGALKVPRVSSGQVTLMYNDPNPSGLPGSDAFRILYDGDFFNTYVDALVFEKTDASSNDPDGGFGFVNTGMDGIPEVALTIRGNGNVGVGVHVPIERLQVAGVVYSTTGGFKFPDGTVQATAAPGGGGLVLPYTGSMAQLGSVFTVENTQGICSPLPCPAIAVKGHASGLTDRGVGVWGESPYGTGVHGLSTDGHAIHGEVASGGSGYAGYFGGDVVALGSVLGSDWPSSGGWLGAGDAGVKGESADPTVPSIMGTNTAGGVSVLGTAPNAGIAVRGITTTGGLAGDFQGNVTVRPNAGGTPVIELRTDAVDVRIPTYVTVLHIRGGADLSERFEISGDAPIGPGMVVSIQPDDPGSLCISSHPYDRTVAGVISGAGGIQPGMLMGAEGTLADGAYPVALTGRVYCKADASYGAITPGDLLTTSATPGHAMRVADYQKANGSVLGKAMSTLEEGTGLVLVLVTLQ